MPLRTDIAAWDNKSADAIQQIYNRHAGSPRFLHAIITLASEPELDRAATWLLKHHCEQPTTSIPPRHAEALYTLAPNIEHWESRLHVLQCMRHIPVPKTKTRQAARFLDTCLASENKLVRAWAYNGYHELANAHPRFRAQADELLEDAMQTESAPAIRARIRQILKSKN